MMGRWFARQTEQEQRDELFSAYLDDQLDAGERARLEEQLAADPALQAELESLRQTVMLMRDLPMLPIPRNFILPRTAATRPLPALRARPQGRAWAAPLLTAATALASLLFVVVLAGDLLLSGAGGLAYAPAAERQAEAPQFALEPPSNGQEVEAGEAVSDATLESVEVPLLAAEAPAEAPPDAAAGGGGEELEAEGITPADAAPTATLLAPPAEAPPKAAPEVATEEENHEMVTPVAEATVSAASVGRGEGEIAPTPPEVEKSAAEEELAIAPTTPVTATAAPVAEVGFAETAPGEVEEEGEWDTAGDERADDLALTWVTPWRVLEITLGLTVLGLALTTVWAWRARRR